MTRLGRVLQLIASWRTATSLNRTRVLVRLRSQPGLATQLLLLPGLAGTPRLTAKMRTQAMGTLRSLLSAAQSSCHLMVHNKLATANALHRLRSIRPRSADAGRTPPQPRAKVLMLHCIKAVSLLLLETLPGIPSETLIRCLPSHLVAARRSESDLLWREPEGALRVKTLASATTSSGAIAMTTQLTAAGAAQRPAVLPGRAALEPRTTLGQRGAMGRGVRRAAATVGTDATLLMTGGAIGTPMIATELGAGRGTFVARATTATAAAKMTGGGTLRRPATQMTTGDAGAGVIATGPLKQLRPLWQCPRLPPLLPQRQCRIHRLCLPCSALRQR